MSAMLAEESSESFVTLIGLAGFKDCEGVV